jgi:hypothetical protein
VPLRQDLAMIAVPNMQSLVILWKQEKAGGTSGREIVFQYAARRRKVLV